MSSGPLIECVTHRVLLMFQGYQSSRSGTTRRDSVITQLCFPNRLHIEKRRVSFQEPEGACTYLDLF